VDHTFKMVGDNTSLADRGHKAVEKKFSVVLKFL